MSPIDCHKCRHYYVTWDKDFPHGCRGFRFKSRQLPNIVVRSSSSGMMNCLLFKKKIKKDLPNEIRPFAVFSLLFFTLA